MPEARTRDFGAVPYQDGDVIEFVRPLAGFAGEREFLMIRPRPDAPWIMLQSLRDAATAFLTLPAHLVAPGYEARLSTEDCDALGWREAVPGALVLILIAAAPDGAATANLLGPVVIDPATRRAVQAIRDDRRYGAAEDLETLMERKEAVRCS